MSSFEKAICIKSLICFLQALRDTVTTIDLRNESSVTGRIDSVDSFMNVHLTEATWTWPSGYSCHFQELFVRGRQIRFVQIPDDLDVAATIRSQIEVADRGRRYDERKNPIKKTGRDRKVPKPTEQ